MKDERFVDWNMTGGVSVQHIVVGRHAITTKESNESGRWAAQSFDFCRLRNTAAIACNTTVPSDSPPKWWKPCYTAEKQKTRHGRTFEKWRREQKKWKVMSVLVCGNWYDGTVVWRWHAFSGYCPLPTLRAKLLLCGKWNMLPRIVAVDIFESDIKGIH